MSDHHVGDVPVSEDGEMAANLAVTTPDDGGALSMLAEASSFDASDALSMLADASLSDRLQENPVGSAAHILHTLCTSSSPTSITTASWPTDVEPPEELPRTAVKCTQSAAKTQSELRQPQFPRQRGPPRAAAPRSRGHATRTPQVRAPPRGVPGCGGTPGVKHLS